MPERSLTPGDAPRDLTIYRNAWHEHFREAKRRLHDEKEVLRSEARDLAIWLVERYDVDRVWLFGSLADDHRLISGHTDIDLAVEGLSSDDYFAAIGELLERASRSVDLVDLPSAQPTLAKKVRLRGRLLYERA